MDSWQPVALIGMEDLQDRYFSPWVDDQRPCWFCQYFEALIFGGSAALCNLNGGPRVRSQPQRGCAEFTREPGVDDDLQWVPTPISWQPGEAPPEGEPPPNSLLRRLGRPPLKVALASARRSADAAATAANCAGASDRQTS
ncbi:hypothetical protein Bpfe_031094 [Biomphalaria pfeifferi]|uniref:Uncharacterized protein n=1 Tax=Biomphalaria pfeifferi TaxID=112525 RepID=A0AAD8ANE1_BIOPF|nr:hypothetical protein Bpfe_031094 [Biomphalaria pfeifferi]